MGKSKDKPKKQAKKLAEWQEEQRKPTPAEVKKIIKRTFGSSHWKPTKKKEAKR